MKAHIGVDATSGLVHHVECTAANVADVTQAHKRLHGQEGTVCGDSGYTGMDKARRAAGGAGRVLDCGEAIEAAGDVEPARAPRYAERWERCKASPGAKVEHPFRVIKRQFGYTKVRYRGLSRTPRRC